MAESFELTTPITFATPSAITAYEVIRFFINLSSPNEAKLSIAVRSNTGAVIEAQYVGPAAATLITALNTANLSVKSLKKRVLERLMADGFLAAGSVTGTPD